MGELEDDESGIVSAVEGTKVELRCNECTAVFGGAQIDILGGLLAPDAASPNT